VSWKQADCVKQRSDLGL